MFGKVFLTLILVTFVITIDSKRVSINTIISLKLKGAGVSENLTAVSKATTKGQILGTESTSTEKPVLFEKVRRNNLKMSNYVGTYNSSHVEATHKIKRSTSVFLQRASLPNEEGEEIAYIHLIGWKWDEVGVFIAFAIFVFTVGYAKVAFHRTPFLEAFFPESFLMIALGAAVGCVMYVLGYRMPLNLDDLDIKSSDALAPYNTSIYYDYVQQNPSIRDTLQKAEENSKLTTSAEFKTFPSFSSSLYFLILIPPIILEQSYALYDAEFADSLYPILLFSILGKLISTFSIGPILHALTIYNVIPPLPSTGNAEGLLSFADSLVFGSIISAVDPVPVLGILHETGVNRQLYFLVFGESLLNDAVSVSLYSSTVAFTGPVKVQESQLGLAVLAFVIKSFGGLLIGVVFGLISALVTRTTQHHRTVEPLTLLGLAYISYLLAEVVHFSGHICLIGCGLLQAHYAFQNISFTSYNSIIHFIKMLSSTSDAAILMFLGMAMVSYSHVWHTGFVLWTLGLCFLCRFIGVYVLAFVHNATSLRWINFRDQTLLAYCGLRGALCLCLAHMLNGARVPQKSLFVTTTLVVILFTTLIQGGSIRVLLSCLRIKRHQHPHSDTLSEGVAKSVFSLVLCGMESIAEVKENGYFKRTCKRIDERFLKNIFLAPNADHELQRMYHKLVLENCPMYSRASSASGQRGKEEVQVYQGSPYGSRRIYPSTSLPWEQPRRVLQHRPFRVVGRSKQRIQDVTHDARMMKAHYEENGPSEPVEIELHEILPHAAQVDDHRKLFIARLRTTSAEKKLREMIMEQTQHLVIPKTKEAFH